MGFFVAQRGVAGFAAGFGDAGRQMGRTSTGAFKRIALHQN
ncbi:hypothetical protein ABH945_000239 [Paraburkholderia sp. GAS333]